MFRKTAQPSRITSSTWKHYLVGHAFRLVLGVEYLDTHLTMSADLLPYADGIIVIGENGGIIEQGSVHEVRGSGGYIYSLESTKDEHVQPPIAESHYTLAANITNEKSPPNHTR